MRDKATRIYHTPNLAQHILEEKHIYSKKYALAATKFRQSITGLRVDLPLRSQPTTPHTPQNGFLGVRESDSSPSGMSLGRSGATSRLKLYALRTKRHHNRGFDE